MTDNSEALLRAARAIDRKLSDDLAVPASALVWSAPGGCSNFALNLAKEVAALTRPPSPAASDGDLEDEVAVFLRAYGDAFVREVLKQAAPVSDGGAVRAVKQSLTTAGQCTCAFDHCPVCDKPIAAQPSPASSTDAAGLPHDLFTHRSAWRDAIRVALTHAEVSPPDIDDRSYWQHELDVFDRTFDAIDRLTSQPSPPPTGSEREKVVAWLRTSEEADLGVRYAGTVNGALAWLAEAVERGDHLIPSGSEQ